MMNKEKFLKSGLLEQYVLGITSPEEAAIVEQYLQEFPELEEELKGMRSAMEKYAKAYAIPSAPGAKGSSARTSEKPGNQPGGRTLQPGFSLIQIAALGILSILVFTLWMQNQGLKTKNQGLKETLSAQQIACEEKLNSVTKHPMAILGKPETKTVVLQGTPLAPEAQVIVYWNPHEKNACLNILQLPAPPTGKQYQIWADVKGEMINMGLIQASREHIQMVDFIAQAESFNITLEPAGGSQHPTVELLYANGLNI